MARYPTFEEYEKRGNFEDGIKRCDEFLAKSPDDVQLLTTKLQLVFATNGDGRSILDQLSSIQPPLHDLLDIVRVEQAVVDSQVDVFPRPRTAGPAVFKLWDAAFKGSASTSHKLDILGLRFSRAILDARTADAQQALIQLKALQPKNRVTFMAHAAVTQLISSSKEDLQSRLALSLARKAVAERFDADKALDCRVPGQIFAIQNADQDLESIRDRSFQESKHVFDAVRTKGPAVSNGAKNAQDLSDPASIPPTEWLSSEVEALKDQFKKLVESRAPSSIMVPFAANAIRLLSMTTSSFDSGRGRAVADTCFLAISALVRLFDQTKWQRYLLHAAHLGELTLRFNPHIHEVRLILIYLYMRLGLGSLAMRLFDSLNVNEIQHDTIGHSLFTRLSITHPHPTSFSKANKLDPLARTAQALGVYFRCEDKLAQAQADVLSHGQTGMLFDLQALRDGLRASTSRRITVLEHRRIARLTGRDLSDGAEGNTVGPRVVANWIAVKDNRDFDAAFNYGYDVERILHSSSGTIPDKSWMLFALAADTAWCLSLNRAPLIVDHKTLVSKLEDVKATGTDQTQTGDPVARLGLLPAEYLGGEVALRALKMLISMGIQGADSKRDFQETIAATTAAIHDLPVETLVDAHNTSLDRVRDYYLYADALRIVIAASAKTKSNNTAESKDQLQRLHALAQAGFELLQKCAKEQRASLKASSIREDMAQDGPVWQALKQFGGDDLQAFCDEVVKSAKEGWEGLSKILMV